MAPKNAAKSPKAKSSPAKEPVEEPMAAGSGLKKEEPPTPKKKRVPREERENAPRLIDIYASIVCAILAVGIPATMEKITRPLVKKGPRRWVDGPAEYMVYWGEEIPKMVQWAIGYAASSEEKNIMQCMGFLIFFLAYFPSFSTPFIARKFCHSGCGFGMMCLNPSSFKSKCFVWGVAATSISMTWEVPYFPLSPFRFTKPRDIGVTVYLTLVSVWFAMELPVHVLAPVFFADPAGAIVGAVFSFFFGKLNFPWYKNKTMMGSAAVAYFTYYTLSFGTDQQRVTVSVLAMLAEAVGGDYDNMTLAAVVLGCWYLAETSQLPF